MKNDAKNSQKSVPTQEASDVIVNNAQLKGGTLKKKKKKQKIVINQQFTLNECIYKGKSYNSYRGYDKGSKKIVVIKMCNQYHAHLEDELRIMKTLQNANCFVSPLWIGEEKISGINYYVKVLKQMGPSLKIVFGLQNHNFQQFTVFLLAYNLILSIENLHKHDIVHRNLKPRKIITDFNLKSLNLFFLDFKNAKKFRHKSGQTIKYQETNRQQNKAFANKFSSLGVHMGISPSQKDDLESLGYMLIYFLNRGRLFQKKKVYLNRDEKVNYYEEQKMNLIPESYKEIIPTEIMAYLTYVKMLNQNDRIDYDFIKKTFKAGLSRLNVGIHDSRYEWSARIEQDLINFNALVEAENKIITEQQQSQEQQGENLPEISPVDRANKIEVIPSPRKITQNSDQEDVLVPVDSTPYGEEAKQESSKNLLELSNGLIVEAVKSPIVGPTLGSNFALPTPPKDAIRSRAGSQINVISDTSSDKFDYNAFLRMNSTESRKNLGHQTIPGNDSKHLMKDPFLKQASNLSRMSDKSLFSRFNSKSFDEGISDEVTSQHPSLDNQIRQLGGGINPFQMFALSRRTKYFNDGNEMESPSPQNQQSGQFLFKKKPSKIEEETEEFSEVIP